MKLYLGIERYLNSRIFQWDLVCEKDSYATVALVLFGVGGLIGNYVFGYLQDFWGRRPSFYAYLLLEIVAGSLSAIAWNYASWVFFRTLVGVTVPAILASPYVLGTIPVLEKLLLKLICENHKT